MAWQSHNAQVMSLIGPGKNDAFDQESDVADVRRASLPPYPAMRHHTASGKQRVIDDAAVGGQSGRSSDSSKLVLCTPPANSTSSSAAVAHPSSTIPCRQTARICLMLIGTVPCPRMRPGHAWSFCTTETGVHLIPALLLAVTSFNRFCRFLDAVFRRLVLVMASMYFDDCNMVDWASSKGSGQWAACQLAAMLGTSFAAAEKRRPSAWIT